MVANKRTDCNYRKLLLDVKHIIIMQSSSVSITETVLWFSTQSCSTNAFYQSKHKHCVLFEINNIIGMLNTNRLYRSQCSLRFDCTVVRIVWLA